MRSLLVLSLLVGCLDEPAPAALPTCTALGCTEDLFCRSTDVCVCSVDDEPTECSPELDED